MVLVRNWGQAGHQQLLWAEVAEHDPRVRWRCRRGSSCSAVSVACSISHAPIGTIDPDFSARAMNLPASSSPLGGMLPPDQRLDGADHQPQMHRRSVGSGRGVRGGQTAWNSCRSRSRCRVPVCGEWRCSTTRFRPAALASYIATSAEWIIATAEGCCAVTAIPTLAATDSVGGADPDRLGLRHAPDPVAEHQQHSLPVGASSAMSSHRMRNSSPPSRPTVSPARKASCIRRATTCST